MDDQKEAEGQGSRLQAKLAHMLMGCHWGHVVSSASLLASSYYFLPIPWGQPEPWENLASANQIGKELGNA